MPVDCEDWTAAIMNRLALRPDVPLTLALDPDDLLLDKGVQALLEREEIPIHLLTLDLADPVYFRYHYEEYRSRWDDGEFVRLLVRAPAKDWRVFPYDLIARAGGKGKIRELALYLFFPNLSYPVVQELARHDRSALAALYARYRESPPSQKLGERKSREYLLEHLYGVRLRSVRSPSDLVRYLLRRHDRKEHLPPSLDRLLVEVWGEERALASLPLREWLEDGTAFYRDLESLWRAYLARQGLPTAEDVPEDVPPALSALDDREVQVYLDTMFLEGRLRPVQLAEPHPVYGWMQAGVYFDPIAYDTDRFRRLASSLESDLPGVESSYREWLDFAPRWAEAVRLRVRPGLPLEEEDTRRFDRLHTEVEARFADWLVAHYAGLTTLAPVPAPVTGHRVVETLAYHRRQGAGRLALLVVDGLAWDQWLEVRDGAGLEPLEEGALFACLPTLTPIARQALLSGKMPRAFADTWQRTDAEERRWREFWTEQGLPAEAVAFLRDPDPSQLEAVLTDSRIQVVAVVLTVVDRMMHGMQLGTAGLHQQVRQWAEMGVLRGIVGALREAGFALWLTSDHGNVEAEGIGKPGEGVLVEVAGQRVRLYTDARQRDIAWQKVQEALCWTPDGLPEDVYALWAPGRSAFLDWKHRAVCHGGIALEEVVVPFIRL